MRGRLVLDQEVGLYGWRMVFKELKGDMMMKSYTLLWEEESCAARGEIVRGARVEWYRPEEVAAVCFEEIR